MKRGGQQDTAMDRRRHGERNKHTVHTYRKGTRDKQHADLMKESEGGAIGVAASTPSPFPISVPTVPFPLT